MNVRGEYDILRSHALQLEGIINALNCCIDDPNRYNLCTELVEEAAKLSKLVSNGIDSVEFNRRRVGA